jgi:hypothetical protein
MNFRNIIVVFQCHHMSVMDFVVSLLIVAEVKPTSEVGTHMRRGYVDPIRWMVIYEYRVPGGALNLNSTNYPDHGHHGDPPLSRKIHHGRAGNRTRDLISSQKRWPLDYEAGLFRNVILPSYSRSCHSVLKYPRYAYEHINFVYLTG